MPFHVHAIKYSPGRVLPSARMLCFVVDEILWQKVVKCTCCSAVIKLCKTIHLLQSTDTRLRNGFVCSKRALLTLQGECIWVIPQWTSAFESTLLKGDPHGEELTWKYEVVWKRRQAQNLNFGISVLYYESEEVDCGEVKITTNNFYLRWWNQSVPNKNLPVSCSSSPHLQHRHK